MKRRNHGLRLFLALMACALAPFVLRAEDPPSQPSPRSHGGEAEHAVESHPAEHHEEHHHEKAPVLTAITNMLGRGDMNNRLNLFDNMSAIPQNRVWFGFNWLQGFQTGVQPMVDLDAGDVDEALFVNNGFARPRREYLYRLGTELEIGETWSIAFQGQYTAAGNTIDSADNWTNPLLMAKWAFIHDECKYLTAVFGVLPQTRSSPREIRESATRFLPGLLFYRGLGDKFFLQGGGQFGLTNTSEFANTIDYALSAGYWLYRHSSIDTVGRNTSVGCPPFVVAFVPQVEVLAKHVLANGNAIDPFDIDRDFPRSVQDPRQSSYREPRNVCDVTIGGKVLFRPNLTWGAAYSRPVTGAYVRRSEFFTTLNFNF